MVSHATTALVQGSPDPLQRGTLWLVGGRVAIDARTAVRADIEIRGRLIRTITAPPETVARDHAATPTETVDLSGYLILPGLINAHDHLEFNLFPRLGNGPYKNCEEWAADIYKPDRSPVREHLAVPEAIRLWWGGLKNLLAGVTTASHHNPYIAEVFEADFPVRVVKRFAWSHSLAFGNNVQKVFPSASKDGPYIIHLGEGTDAQSAEEIFTLRKLGALNSRTVIVHGVGLDATGHALLEKYGAALVWCPTSNLFTLGKTLDFQTVASCRRMALGNDSALTAQGDLLDEIRYAHQQRGISPERAYSLVTDLAADVLRLQGGEGTLRPGARADLIALEYTGKSPGETLAETRFANVELAMIAGEPKLYSPAMAARWPEESCAGFEPLSVGGILRLVRAPVAWLITEARRHLGRRICLAGREIGL